MVWYEGICVFVPFLGDFLSMLQVFQQGRLYSECFRPLSWGLSFNLTLTAWNGVFSHSFRPLSWGPFFNLNGVRQGYSARYFRPLSRGLFFNLPWCTFSDVVETKFSSPFSGTFFQYVCWDAYGRIYLCFRPLSRGLFFNSVPAKPQPVCSRKRICGGDGGIASSGTLLRR